MNEHIMANLDRYVLLNAERRINVRGNKPETSSSEALICLPFSSQSGMILSPAET